MFVFYGLVKPFKMDVYPHLPYKKNERKRNQKVMVNFVIYVPEGMYTYVLN